MKVCHLWDSFPPIENGGVEKWILNLSNFLADNCRIDFAMLTDKSNARYPAKLTLPKKERISNIEVYRLGPTVPTFLKNASNKILGPDVFLNDYAIMSLFKQACKIKEIAEVDVFHLHGLWQPLFPKIGMLLSKHFNRPLIVSLHGDVTDTKQPYCMPLRKPFALESLRHASAVTTFSPHIKNTLETLEFADKTFLIKNFINVDSFERPVHYAQQTGKRVVTVSRLDPYKDPLTVIHAFASLLKEAPESTLLVVGYGPLYKAANSLVKELNLESSVIFTGLTNNIRDYLWGNDIFVATRSSYIGVLEAWAAGLAVIAPQEGILGEIVEHNKNGLLVEPSNPSQIAQSILKIANDPALRLQLSSNGKETVKEHDIQMIARKFERIYRSVAN